MPGTFKQKLYQKPFCSFEHLISSKSPRSVHHAPYLAIPSVHFFTSFQPPLTDKTRLSQNFDSSLWAGASEFRTGSSGPGHGIIKWSYGAPADHFCLQLYHLWCILTIAFSDLTFARCSVLLSYFYNNINKLSLISNGHLLTDTTTLKGQNWPQCNPTWVYGSFTETIRRINSRSASHPWNNGRKASRCCSFTTTKYCGSYWSQWDTNFQPTTTELKANFAPRPASLLQNNLHSYLANKYQGLNLHLLLF